MKIISVLIAAALLGAVALPACGASNQARLRTQRPLSAHIASFPRLVAAKGDDAAARINRALTKAEIGVGCEGSKGSWNREVRVAMRGAGYLSLIATDDYYCGGAHPDTDTVPLVFDLRTGAPVDWKTLAAAGVIKNTSPGPGDADEQPRTVDSPVLWKAYAQAALRNASKACSDVFADPASVGGSNLLLWPDAQSDGLDVMAADFPHVVEACGPPIILNAAQMRAIGFNPSFIAAIGEAHRRGFFGMTR